MDGNPNGTVIDGYLDCLLTQRQLSLDTLAAYRRDLAALQTFVGNTVLADVSHFQIRQFAAKLHAQGIGPRSIARTLSAWRGFFRWLAEQTPMVANPVDGVRPPKRARTLPKALSVDDAVRLVSDKGDSGADDAIRLRDRAMFELLYSSGLRVSELAGLDLQHVRQQDYASNSWLDAEAGEVIVTGKGSRQRSVPVGKPALVAITAWLVVRPQLAKNDAGSDSYALFVGTRGARITPRTVQLRLKAHALTQGIPADVHPHMLRHSFASHLLQSSGDLRAVQELLGHASIASTQVYTSLDFQRLAQVYDAAHPRAKKK
ncbi:MAG: xerC [Burkholderiaceae bacterium]|nr:xerC [Burkholderiaceae bacterium]